MDDWTDIGPAEGSVDLQAAMRYIQARYARAMSWNIAQGTYQPGADFMYAGTYQQGVWRAGMTTERPDPLAPPEGYGQKPGEESEQVSDTCTDEHCDLPAIWRHTFGDLNEHIAVLYSCEGHGPVLDRPGVVTVCTICRQQMRLERREAREGFRLWRDAGLPERQPDPRVQAALDQVGMTGPDRVREAVRKARGGDPPAQIRGFA